MEESVIDADEIEGGEVTRGRARTVDDLVSTRAHTRRGGEAERATEGDVAGDIGLGGSVRQERRTRCTEDCSVGAGESKVPRDAQARGVERGTRYDGERLSCPHVDCTRAIERLTRDEREARGGRGVEVAGSPDGDARGGSERPEGRQRQRTAVHPDRTREGVGTVKRERARPDFRESPGPTDGIGEDHIIGVRVDDPRLGGGNRQAVRNIVRVERGKLQRGITRERQTR